MGPVIATGNDCAFCYTLRSASRALTWLSLLLLMVNVFSVAWQTARHVGLPVTAGKLRRRTELCMIGARLQNPLRLARALCLKCISLATQV